ncbi:MAG: hypothetical protein ACRCZY_08570 [Phocaeicola sp.]
MSRNVMEGDDEGGKGEASSYCRELLPSNLVEGNKREKKGLKNEAHECKYLQQADISPN